MKLQDRVGLIFGTVLATLLAVMFLTGASYFATQRERTTIEQRVGPIMEACRQMERLADLMLEEQFIILKDAQARPNAMRQFARYRMEFDLAYQEALLAARNPVVRVLLDEIASLHAKAQANQLRLEALVAQGKVEQASREHRAIGRPLVQIRDDAEKLYTQGIRVVTEMDEEALRRGNLAFRTSFALSLLGAAIAAYLWRQTSRDLVEPLRAIQAAAGELAEGRFIQASHPRADRVAELAALQDDFNRMSARLQDGARRLQATNAELEDQVADRTATLQGLVAELQTLDRLKSDFLANMSHELLTPLNFIVGFGSSLEDGLQGPLNAAQQATVGKMLAGADRLTRMVRNTLDYTQLQAGKLVVRPNAVDYAGMVRQVAVDARLALDVRGQELTLDVPTELPPVQADEHRLRQVLDELLDNASRFSPDGAVLRLTVLAGPDLVTTEVADPGEGIPAEALPLLFTPFYQVNSTRTRGHTGMGLGLAIAFHLVAKMKGSMLVSSQPNVGTTIRFSLPRAVGVPEPEASRYNQGERS